MEYEYILTASGELYHWGIKGMKWGERRYQNKDGTLTAAGKKRYNDARDAIDRKRDAVRREKERRNTGNRAEDTELARKLRKEEADTIKARREHAKLTSSENTVQGEKRLVEETKGLTDKLKNINEKSMRNQPRTRLDLSNMSDKELRDQINRELLERQYNDVFNPPTISRGRQRVNDTLEVAGDVLAVTASALGIALAIIKIKNGGD